MERSDCKSSNTQGSLESRHVLMIALGGVIGAGLFIGSSAPIANAGPAILLGFLLVGGLIMAVMRMLGEMLIAIPGKGSFVSYIRQAHGDRVGFTVGWIYWFFWVVVMGSEAIAGALLLRDWLSVPVWVLAISLIISLKLVNLAAPRFFGESEFWLSSIKVISIFLFILLSIFFLIHKNGYHVISASRFTLLGQGGFFPHGLIPLFSVVPTILFTMMGSEIATVAASESSNPAESVGKITRSIGLRITIFYFLSVFLILCIVPWTNIIPGKSPFVAAMEAMRISGAGTLMRIVVFSAAMSSLNSCMYITSRILTELSLEGDAPSIMARRLGTGSPAYAVIFSTVCGTLVAFASIMFPDTIFSFLLNCSGGLILIVYALIVTSYIKIRNNSDINICEYENFTLKAFPFLNYAILLSIFVIFGMMVVDPHQRATGVSTILCALFFLLLSFLCRGKREWTVRRTVD